MNFTMWFRSHFKTKRCSIIDFFYRNVVKNYPIDIYHNNLLTWYCCKSQNAMYSANIDRLHSLGWQTFNLFVNWYILVNSLLLHSY